ncbi:MAG: adenosylcobinamide-GDP ribazoletransferase [Actinomycetota bacterium]|nr:adenosylcobinamide-GDP ribazoletransferase [Actinomycetota bacterium]
MRLALSFLTIIPTGIREELDSTAFGRSTKYFPLVGLVIGLILAAVYALVSLRITGAAADFIVIVVLVALTRALHLDAVADTFDGLFGGRDKEHSLAIMKDSQVGSFGLVALVAVLGLKTLLLAAVPGAEKLAATLVFPVIGRYAASIAITTQPRARKDGLGALFAEGAGKVELAWASIITIAVAVIAAGLMGIIALLAALAFVMMYIIFVKRKIGGMTGDTVGALIELTEVTVLLVYAAL